MTDFLTAAQRTAGAGHDLVPLVQDTVTGVIYGKDGSPVSVDVARAAHLPAIYRSNEGAPIWFGSLIRGVTFNQTASLSTVDATYGLKIEAESDFDAVAVCWRNRGANPMTACNAIVGVTETADTTTNASISQVVIGGIAYGQLAPAGSVLGWRPVTWGGNATVTIGSGASAVQWAVSDFIPLSSIPRADGGTRPLVMIRAHHNGVAEPHVFIDSTTGQAARTATYANRGRIAQISDVTNGVTNPAATGGLTVAGFEVFPIFRYRKPCINVMCCGDSIQQNNALVADSVSSAGWRASADASTPSRPVHYQNLSASGKSFDEYWARGKELINAGVVPQVLIITPWSINDGFTTPDRQIETGRSRCTDILKYAYQKGIEYVVWFPILPFNTMTSAQDGFRKSYNAFLQAMAADNFGTKALSFAVGNGATPEQWIAGLNFGDGTHPNEVCIDTVMAPAMTQIIRALP